MVGTEAKKATAPSRRSVCWSLSCHQASRTRRGKVELESSCALVPSLIGESHSASGRIRYHHHQNLNEIVPRMDAAPLFFFLCSFFRHLFFADDHCWSALTRPEGGRDPARPARHARWANPVAPLLGNEKQEWILCMLRGGGLPWKSWRPDMPSPDIRVTSRPTQTWAHGHVHLQILARISSLALIPPNPPESRVSFCGPPSLECSLYA